MLTDGSGNVVARQDYLPFGEEIPADTAGRSASLLFGASDGVEQKFTGQIRDSETGMDFFLARYYASAVGRFTSPDPMNLGADATDPQSWNAYAYVRNNPLALVDPMGLCHMGADNVAYDDEPGDCGGGSVTVVAQAPPDVMPIFVSLPSLLSDTQQPAPTAPPPAVTEAGVGITRPTNTVATISAAPPTPWYKNSCITTALGNAVLKVGIDVIGLIPEAEGFTKAFENTAGYQLARAIGNSAGYQGVVATQYGMKVVAQGKGAIAMVNGAFGLGDTSVDGLISAGLTIAGFVPGLGQGAAVFSIFHDAYVTAKAVGQCY